MAKARSGTSCTSTYRSFAKQNLGREIKKAGSVKAGMKAMAKKWRECKRR